MWRIPDWDFPTHHKLIKAPLHAPYLKYNMVHSMVQYTVHCISIHPPLNFSHTIWNLNGLNYHVIYAVSLDLEGIKYFHCDTKVN